MNIWIFLNGIQQGPYTLDQLRMLNLTPDTPVWYEGLPDWAAAAMAPATMCLFAPQTPPPPSPSYAPGQSQVPNLPPKPSTYLVWSVILTILCCSPFALAAIFTGMISSSRYQQGNYAGAQSMSEATAWLIMLSIVWGLVGWPVCMAVSCV